MPTRQVLIVDDEDDIREVAQLSLEMNSNWEVLTAASGQEALEIATQQQPQVILLDVMMPDLDGFGVWQQLQANPQTKEIPVIFLTAKVQAQEKRDYHDLGVRGVLNKPFDPLQLANQVAQILGWEL